ncbi:unnamed protein product, partial [Ectocarpus sp. 12 AP-2014]
NILIVGSSTPLFLHPRCSTLALFFLCTLQLQPPRMLLINRCERARGNTSRRRALLIPGCRMAGRAQLLLAFVVGRQRFFLLRRRLDVVFLVFSLVFTASFCAKRFRGFPPLIGELRSIAGGRTTKTVAAVLTSCSQFP